MSHRKIPNLTALLAPMLQAVPAVALPHLLSGLERTAAGRYRHWADVAPLEHRAGLLACAAREGEIADRVETLFALDPAHRKAVDAVVPKARELYVDVFRDLEVREQLRIQASAEREGAAAWRGVASQHESGAVRDALEACARLEEESADHLDGLLASWSEGAEAA